MRGLTLSLLALLAACAGPPPEAYVGGVAPAGDAVGLGRNREGEACTQQVQAGGAAIFCGTWQQPSGHVQRGPAGDIAALASGSAWRSALDSRFACGEPAASSILGDAPALVLSCNRRVGGWPQVAFVATVDGMTYYADGILPALPVLERSVGVLSGRLSAAAAPALPLGAADGLLAARLAAQSFGANDIGRYDQLMLAGTAANLSESYVAAEQAFRAAMAVQQKALGENDPSVAVPLMHVALQLSDQGRSAEADVAFARATALVPRAPDATARARLLHYRGLAALNRGQDAQALPLLQAAESRYAALLPADMLATAPAAAGPFAVGRRVDSAANLVLPPQTEAALIGVVETRRYQAIVLRDLGRGPDADAMIRSADALATANHLRQRNLTARLYRTGALIADQENDGGLRGMTLASADFGQSQPGTRPLAATELLRAGELRRAGRTTDALELCRRGVALLRGLKAGTTDSLMAPCLQVFYDAGTRAEMFEAAQLVQGGITSQQIALASARLLGGAQDPKVGDAIRRQQDAGNAVAELQRQRDALAVPGPRDLSTGPPVSADELNKQVIAARTALADADAALQAAAPQYGQLVQENVSAADVLAALAPGEAFASITLSAAGGWVFVLRDNQVDAAPTGLSLPQVTAMVKRIRATIEPTGPTPPRFDTVDAARLYADTLGRLDERLQGVRSLVVSPPGPLLSLPFAVLLTGPADPDQLATAPWLVRRMAITHVPAPANFVSLRKVAGSSRATRPWFGFGDFRPVTLPQAEQTYPRPACEDSAKLFAGLPPLPFARRELDATRALLGGAPGDELEGAAYTADRVRRTNLSDYRVLHFATHALLPSDLRCQTEPAIVASAPAGARDASGALLASDSVMGLKLDADVVILSACNSGGPGDTSGGESLSGLARAFFYAGARALMVTHWSVNDQIAALLVADTMRRLRTGDPDGVAGALRGAELSILDGAGKSLPAAVAHPFYWAPFALIGEGRGRTLSAAVDAGRGA